MYFLYLPFKFKNQNQENNHLYLLLLFAKILFNFNQKNHVKKINILEI
jgi:hypothetical protein